MTLQILESFLDGYIGFSPSEFLEKILDREIFLSNETMLDEIGKQVYNITAEVSAETLPCEIAL